MLPMEKIVLYNILKVPENLMDRRCEKCDSYRKSTSFVIFNRSEK